MTKEADMHRPRTRHLARFLISVALAGGSLVAFAGAGVASSTATPPRNASLPIISGTPEVGSTFFASPGSWHGTTPMSFAYQWIRCTAQVSDCGPIGGATHSSYQLTSADRGRKLIVSVTATNSAGSSAAQSRTSPVVRARSGPANTAAPSISGAAQVGATLTASPGSWSGTQPISFAYQWSRCDANGNSCAGISGATGQSYTATSADEGQRLRVTVTARNAVGSRSANSGPTGVVAPAGPGGQIPLGNGLVSIPVASVSLPQRLIVSDVRFTPNPVRSIRQSITIRVRVMDTRGFVVRDALVFVRATPLLTTTPPETGTQVDGWVTYVVHPRLAFPIKRGFNVQFFVQARKPGESVLAGVTGCRLVQVATAPPR
jgi:hypothetical protein